jgi:hypothetical protein
MTFACSIAAAACGKSDDPGSSSPSKPAPPAVAPDAAAPATAVAPPAPPPKARFQIQLRSTPTGAEASVDGRPIGRTPTQVAVEDDDKEHEFTFVLPGYALERYRTHPVQSGVIHARMRTIPRDAGP